MPVRPETREIARQNRDRQGVVIPRRDSIPFVGGGGNVFNALEYPNCFGWWNTNYINAAPDTAVVHLPDLSGLGKGLVLAGAPPGPTFRLINGVPALYYGPSVATGLKIPISIGNFPTPFTTFSVVQNEVDTDDNLDHSVFGITGTFVLMLHIDNITNNAWTLDGPGAGNLLVDSTLYPPTTTTRQLWTVQARADNTQSVRLNGVEVGTGTNTYSTPTGGFALGSRGGTDRLWRGSIFEQVLYNPGMNDAVIPGLEKKLGKKWGIIIP